MAEIVVKRAIDRSKYPKRMMYVDRQGNICVADKRQPLNEEEKAKRQADRDQKHTDRTKTRADAREKMRKAKKEAQKHPSVESASAFEEAEEGYNEVMGR